MTSRKDHLPTERPGAEVSDTRELGPVPSGVRAPVDPATLERLLDLAVELPVDEGTHAVVRTCLDRMSALLPELALGVCIVDASLGEQLVDMRLPEGVEAGTGHDPSRLFPGLRREQVQRFSDPLAGSTFHVGTGDAAGPSQAAQAVLDRALPLLEQGVRRARTLERKAQSTAALKRLQAQIIQTDRKSVV